MNVVNRLTRWEIRNVAGFTIRIEASDLCMLDMEIGNSKYVGYKVHTYHHPSKII